MRLVVAAALLVFPMLAHAQDYRASILYAAPADTASSLAYVPRDPPEQQPSIAWPILGGAAGGFVGMVGGVAVGASIDPGYDDISPGMAYGFVAGEMLFLPLGVHLGNGRKGNFLADLAVSAVIGTTAVLVTSVTDDGIPLLIGAGAQYAAVVATERSTAKSKLARASILARAPGTAPGDSAAGADSLPPFHAPQLPEARQPGIAYPIMGAVCGAVVGSVGGAALGGISDSEYSDDIPVGALFGYFLGESVLMPLGAHLGNARKGSFAGDLALSLLGHIGSIAIGSVTGTGVYVTGLAGTTALTIANERRVAHRRIEGQASAP